jgi:hypothetical protein
LYCSRSHGTDNADKAVGSMDESMRFSETFCRPGIGMKYRRIEGEQFCTPDCDSANVSGVANLLQEQKNK